MAELEDLGTPPVFAEIVRVGYAVARLRLPTDATVPREVAATAAKVDQATMALQGAVDLAAELQDEGVRQPVCLIPPPGAELDQERAHVWARHAELQASVEEFVGTCVGFPPPMGRPTEYQVVMTQAVQALGALEEQRRLALGSRGPRPPEPAGPAPSPGPEVPRPDRAMHEPPKSHETLPGGDGDRPPAAARSVATRGPSEACLGSGATDAPNVGELERRVSGLARKSIRSGWPLGLESPPLSRTPADARELCS